MVITTRVHNGVWYRLYEPKEPTYKTVVFLHGSGEGGLPDGSQILKVESNGITKLAAQGREFPFRIIAPQGIKKAGYAITDFAEVRRHLPSLISKYTDAPVVLTGLSQGGMETVGWMTHGLFERNADGTPRIGANGDRISLYQGGEQIGAYLVICGQAPGDPRWCSEDKPCLLIHGDSDDAVNIWQARKIKTEVNKCLGRKNLVELIEIPAGEHSTAWVRSYNPDDSPYGQAAYKFINNFFDSIVLPPPQYPKHVVSIDIINATAAILSTEDGTQFQLTGLTKLN